MNNNEYHYYYNYCYHKDKETRRTLIPALIYSGLSEPPPVVKGRILTEKKLDCNTSSPVISRTLRHLIADSKGTNATSIKSTSTGHGGFVTQKHRPVLYCLAPTSIENFANTTTMAKNSVNLQKSSMTSLMYTDNHNYSTMAGNKYNNPTTRLFSDQENVSTTSDVGLAPSQNESIISRDIPLVDVGGNRLQDTSTRDYSLTPNLNSSRLATINNISSSLVAVRNSTDEYGLIAVRNSTDEYDLVAVRNSTDDYGLVAVRNSTDEYGEFFSEDYTYDYNIADSSVDLNEILPVSFVYGLALAIGVVGNLLVIAAVARDRRLRSITNLFLTSLASADLALLCFCVPVKCVAFFSFTWAFGFFLCKSVHYFQIVAMVCSVMTLTVMSIERNIAILFPLRSKRIVTRGRARIVVALLWVGSALLALPILAGQKHAVVGDKLKAYWCIKEWDKPLYSILFESYMLVLLFLVPVCVMVVSYTTICLELSRGTKFRRQATSTLSTVTCRGYASNVNRQENCARRVSCKGSCVARILQNRHQERMDQEKMKVIRMLIVVVVLFAVCWGPILINNLLVALNVLNKLHIGHLKPLRQTIFLLSYLNSSLNPLVYGFMSRHFRRGFREAICVCCSSNGRRDGENRARVPNNRNCCYASDSGTSVIRTGTIRLSEVTEHGVAAHENGVNNSPVGVRKYGRKVWARTDIVALDLHM